MSSACGIGLFFFFFFHFLARFKELNKQNLARKNVVLLVDFIAAIQAVANEESQDKKVILARYKIKSLQTKAVI
jgi:hypothetical protein